MCYESMIAMLSDIEPFKGKMLDQELFGYAFQIPSKLVLSYQITYRAVLMAIIPVIGFLSSLERSGFDLKLLNIRLKLFWKLRIVVCFLYRLIYGFYFIN